MKNRSITVLFKPVVATPLKRLFVTSVRTTNITFEPSVMTYGSHKKSLTVFKKNTSYVYILPTDLIYWKTTSWNKRSLWQKNTCIKFRKIQTCSNCMVRKLSGLHLLASVPSGERFERIKERARKGANSQDKARKWEIGKGI